MTRDRAHRCRVHPSTSPPLSEDILAWLSLHCLCQSLSVWHQCRLPAIWCLTHTVCFLPFSFRHGQEGRSQANARVVQAGAGEKRPGPLWVGTHDIVSTVHQVSVEMDELIDKSRHRCFFISEKACSDNPTERDLLSVKAWVVTTVLA